MRLARFVLSVRSLMLGILAIGLLLGFVVDRRYRERRRAAAIRQACRQHDMTAALVLKIEQEAFDSLVSLREAKNFSKGGGGNCSSSSGAARWSEHPVFTCDIGSVHRKLIDLGIEGGSEGLGLETILIIDRGAEFNAKVIERLGRTYREQRWSYRVVAGKVDGPK